MATSQPAQSWSPIDYARNARFVADLGVPVVDLLAPRPGERILDLGCGDGALTEVVLAAGARGVGVDASEAMVEAARVRGLDVRVMDGRSLGWLRTFAGPFMAGLADPEVFLADVERLLAPALRDAEGQWMADYVRLRFAATLTARG